MGTRADEASRSKTAEEPEEAEPHECSGLTTRLLLAYTEREGGRHAVEEVLLRTALLDREAELRDENRWFADEIRVRLFEAAAEVLEDPQLARHAGEAAIDLGVGQTLKLTLRALGSSRLVYSNIVRANAKFNRVHPMDLVELGSNGARIRTRLLPGRERHRCDCEYNIGLLSCVPQIFGDPPALVRHPTCISDGAEECVFDVSWGEGRRALPLIAGALATLAVAILGLLLTPLALIAAGAMALGLAAGFGWRALAAGDRRAELLAGQVAEERDASSLLMTSLHELVSALEVDEVLSKVTGNARAAVGGADFALLVTEPDGHHLRSSSQLPPTAVGVLERWANERPDRGRSSQVVDDVSRVEGLRALAEDPERPLRSLCLAPLRFRERQIGVLVALAESTYGFLPRDAKRLESYAAQAAIALTNARLYAAQHELAIQDPLTGLYNHRHFHEMVGQELDRCRRYGTELAVVTMDLDDFKRVNDTTGHAAGDQLLRNVGEALERVCRSSDTAFRVGGDEFALLLPQTGVEEARAVAGRAEAAIELLDERTRICTGVASWPADGPTKNAMLSAADADLYAAKGGRRGSKPRPDHQQRRVPGPQGNDRQRIRLACANRIATRLAPLADPERIAETTVQELLSSFDLYLAAVLRIDGDELRTVAWAGPLSERTDELEAWRQPLTSGVTGRAVRSGEAVLVTDTGDDAAYLGTRAADAGSELSTPIRLDGELWGVLDLEHAEPGAFGFDDLLFAETIAAAVGAALQRGQLYAGLEGTFMHTLAVLCDALEAKDAYTATHAREVADLCARVGARLGMGERMVRNLSYGALLHDIGKIGVPSEILHKPDRLTAEEFEEIEKHPDLGAKMLERIPYFADVHPLVRASHERWDGGGYPRRLAGEEIPLGARVIAACDAFNAMTTDRPYRRALSSAEAIAELRRHAGSQFDPAVVQALLDELAVDGELSEPVGAL